MPSSHYRIVKLGKDLQSHQVQDLSVPTPTVRAGGDLALSRVPRQQHSRCIPEPCSGSAAARELGAAPLLVPSWESSGMLKC